MGFMMGTLRNSTGICGAMWKSSRETQEVVQWSRACAQRAATKPKTWERVGSNYRDLETELCGENHLTGAETLLKVHSKLASVTQEKARIIKWSL